MQFVVGIDPSMTSTGLTALDEFGELVDHRTVESSNIGNTVKQRMMRIETVTRTVLSFCRTHAPRVICIEGYSYGSDHNAARMVEFGCLIRYAVSREFNLFEVAPTALKKFITGKGGWKGGGKVPLIVEIVAKYGVQFKSDDEFDAYSLARVALQLAELEKPSNQHQREVIKQILEGPQPKSRKTAT